MDKYFTNFDCYGLFLLDQKIAKKQAEIEALKAQKHKLLHPISIRAALTKAKEAGMSPEEVAEKLGIEIDE